MPNRRVIAICVALSALLHLAGLFLALQVPSKGAPRDEVMVVDLADMPRSPDFLPPKPGIVEGARPRPQPVPAPRPAPRAIPVPRPEALVGRVPDRPVDPSLKPEKAFPSKPPRAEKPAGEPAPPAPGRAARAETPSEAPPSKASPSPPSPDTAPSPGGLKSLRDLTPSLGKMVMAKRETGGGRGSRTSSGNAVGTGGKAAERGEIAEERGTGTHLTALNAPEIQYISYFASIKRKIELVWQYPADAMRGGVQGDLVIDFTIGRGGTLDSLSLIRGSGYRVLDEEAITAIRKAAPYYPIPKEYAIPNLQIRAHFVYELHNLRLQ